MKPCNHDSHENYEKLIGPIREEAKRLGYAIGVHGTLIRDIDLIACPWTNKAVSARELADALGVVIKSVIGMANHHASEESEYFWRGSQKSKPHGRLCWTWHLTEKCNGSYVDLSVMPRYDEGNCDCWIIRKEDSPEK